MVFDRTDALGDDVASVVQVGHEFLQVGDGRRFHVVERREIGPVGTQQPLQFTDELLGVGPQRLQMRLELGEGAEDAAVSPGLKLVYQVTEPVADGVEHRGLQRAGGREQLHRVGDARERRLTALGQRVLQIAALVLARCAVVL